MRLLDSKEFNQVICFKYQSSGKNRQDCVENMIMVRVSAAWNK